MQHFSIVPPGADPLRDADEAAGKCRSFSRAIALRMFVFACIATALVAAFAFDFAARQAEDTLLSDWNRDIERRARYESDRFTRAETAVDKLAARFVQSYADPAVLPSVDFDRYFAHRKDGTVRLRRAFYSGIRDETGVVRSGVTGFVARNRPSLDEELRRRLVLTYETVAEFGPGIAGDFSNIHASLPENALIIYSPGEPWGLEAASDLDMTSLSVLASTLQSNNPARKPRWTGLYYDSTVSKWTVTYQKPVDLKGRHLINSSIDVSMTDLLQTIMENGPDGAEDLILSKDGMLVAYPAAIDELMRNAGQISVDKFGDARILEIYRTLAAAAPRPAGEASIVYNAEIHAYIGSVELAGPGWWMVTVYPKALVNEKAVHAAGSIMLLIAVLFAAFIVTVVVVLRTSVSGPIHKMTRASRRLARGDYEAVYSGAVDLPVDRKDEIGALARSFQQMARQLGFTNRRLENSVRQRTIELELANEQLQELSRKDGLTGALNRRAFDEDLANAFAELNTRGVPFALSLFDVDCFKLYNDRYGHAAGDIALRTIVSEIEAALPRAKVYRYGGEEIAAILPCTTIDDANAAVRATVHRIAGLGIEHRDSPHGRVTISAGTKLVDTPGEIPTSVMVAVDEALYAAKRGGRNRSVFATDPAFRLKPADPASD
ncbi:response regulator [Novosphingobium sp. PC22D]|uniref:diguanylate cyclase n=1 Tax=Novosphingobium sp. PC22D TaxID=1962403 RepID=UPI000BFABF14|nr:diguanylate cyclase [Novosphingobium sp. PC22D]PEQ12811.1 response regulator [Novosphingobium sp. PC22D]